MKEYFSAGNKYRGRTPTSLPTTLNNDLQAYHRLLQSAPDKFSPSQHQQPIPSKLKSEHDLLALKTLAQDRDTWRNVTRWIQETDDTTTTTAQSMASVPETAQPR